MDYGSAVTYLSNALNVESGKIIKSLVTAPSLKRFNVKESTFSIKRLALEDVKHKLGKIQPTGIFQLIVHEKKKRRGIIIYAHFFAHRAHARCSVSTISM